MLARVMNEPTNNESSTSESLAAMAQRLTETLADFGVNATVGEISRGPTITRFELYPGKGVRTASIFELSDDLVAALKTEGHVFGPVPGKSCLGIDVANAVKTNVLLRDVWNSDEWQKAEGQLPIALGKDVYNRLVISDLAEFPHLLIGGRTGSGKSVLLDTMLTSLLRRLSPEQVRFVMIDLNIIELQHFSGLPHLIGPIVNRIEGASLALQWVLNEIYDRYEMLAQTGQRNLDFFNKRPKPQSSVLWRNPPFERIKATPEDFFVANDSTSITRQSIKYIPDTLPRIVVVLNEPEKLMLEAPTETDLAISRITQMGRAVGVHLIFSTRDLSPGTITSKIAANIPARIAFQTGSRADSRTLVDAHGPEKLLGKGDMFYLAPNSCKLQRIQAPFITEQEIAEIIASSGNSNEDDSTEKPENHDPHEH